MRPVLVRLLRPGSPMNRVLEIEELVTELLDVDEISLLQYQHWNEVADDVIKKLRYVRLHCIESARAALLTPPSSEGSVHSEFLGSSSSSGDFSPSSSPYEAAAQAFDRQIYSRCIQIVEEAQRQSALEMSLISLAHHSYQSMVEDAEDVEDSAKFALWWVQFLERAESGRPMNEKAEMCDYRIVALERLFQLDPSSRKTTSVEILKVSIRSYKLAAVHVRAFHSKCLRRLEKLVYWRDETRPYCEGYPEFTEAEALATEVIRTSLRDQRRFEAETGAKRHQDIDYVMCADILSGLAERMDGEDGRLSRAPADKTIENLMEKTFLNDQDSGYASLPRSDTEEEDIVLRL